MCEVPSDGSMAISDPASLRDVLHEAEWSGALNLKLWGHECERPTGAAHIASDVDHFDVKTLDGEEKWCLKPQVAASIETIRISNIGNFVSSKQVYESVNLEPLWILTVDQALATMVPKKPEFFFKRDIRLQAN